MEYKMHHYIYGRVPEMLLIFVLLSLLGSKIEMNLNNEIKSEFSAMRFDF